MLTSEFPGCCGASIFSGFGVGINALFEQNFTQHFNGFNNSRIGICLAITAPGQEIVEKFLIKKGFKKLLSFDNTNYIPPHRLNLWYLTKTKTEKIYDPNVFPRVKFSFTSFFVPLYRRIRNAFRR